MDEVGDDDGYTVTRDSAVAALPAPPPPLRDPHPPDGAAPQSLDPERRRPPCGEPRARICRSDSGDKRRERQQVLSPPTRLRKPPRQLQAGGARQYLWLRCCAAGLCWLVLLALWLWLLWYVGVAVVFLFHEFTATGPIHQQYP